MQLPITPCLHDVAPAFWCNVAKPKPVLRRSVVSVVVRCAWEAVFNYFSSFIHIDYFKYGPKNLSPFKWIK